MSKQLKYLQEAGFKPRTEKKIINWLLPWIEELIKRAGNPKYSILKMDIKKDELFTTTMCHDLINGNKEDTIAIRKRKGNIALANFLKQLIGEPLNIKKLECGRCGSNEIELIPFNAGGYLRHCKNCDQIILHGNLKFIGQELNELVELLRE